MSAMRVCACRVFCLGCVHVVACHGTNEMHARAHARNHFVYLDENGRRDRDTGSVACQHLSGPGRFNSWSLDPTGSVFLSFHSGLLPALPHFSSWPPCLRKILCECVYIKMKVVMDAVKADCYRALALLLLHVSLLHASWSVSASLPL